jgi:hypothetical protein
MTIAATYLVSEGVVFGSDSSTMVSIGPRGGSGVLQLLSHSQKVFEIGENSRLGLCTWGAGSLGGTSHRTVVSRLAEELTEDITVLAAAEKLGDIVKPILVDSGVDFVGYYLGGWEHKTHDPACVKIEVKKDKVAINPIKTGMCSFSGNPNFFTRVFRGFDPEMPERLCQEIKASLPDSEVLKDFDDIFKKAFEKASLPLVAAGFKDLPIREAIDFVYSYLHITVKATKFRFGAPACGGPVEVGFITTDRHFRWARHKSFVSAIIEQEGRYEDIPR